VKEVVHVLLSLPFPRLLHPAKVGSGQGALARKESCAEQYENNSQQVSLANELGILFNSPQKTIPSPQDRVTTPGTEFHKGHGTLSQTKNC
jgi:hypothetical protein